MLINKLILNVKNNEFLKPIFRIFVTIFNVLTLVIISVEPFLKMFFQKSIHLILDLMIISSQSFNNNYTQDIDIQNIDTSQFECINLEFLDNLNLLNRFDTKFVVNINSLTQLLENLKNDFFILEINNFRIFNYTSIYFDDNDYFFYYQHHNNASNRLKIRNRYYHETEQLFFEIKQKLSSQKTVKFRKLTDKTNIVENFVNDVSFDNLREIKNLDLNEKITVTYKRITLVSKDLNEKITIDIGLGFDNNSKTENHCQNSGVDFDKFSSDIQLKDNILQNICVFEIKQLKANYNTKVFQLLRQLNYKADISFSKYCIGLILTGENVKYNLFKPTLLQIEKVIKNY